MTAPAEPVIAIENLVVDYVQGPRRTRAVDGVSFSVRPGETTGFIGLNGAGKSTTMKCLMGFVFPVSGQIRVFGRAPGDPDSRARIGYLPEVSMYYPFLKARELLELYGTLSGLTRRDLRARIPGLLEQVGLGGRGEHLLRTFSKGMQQRLGIAQALVAKPELLILDELNSGLDPVGRHDLRQTLLGLKREGCTILFSSHELNEVESLCDHLVIIHRGKVIKAASAADLLGQRGEQSLEDFFIRLIRATETSAA
jgi:ABC-2 type transport system ATP-binding protein